MITRDRLLPLGLLLSSLSPWSTASIAAKISAHSRMDHFWSVLTGSIHSRGRGAPSSTGASSGWSWSRGTPVHSVYARGALVLGSAGRARVSSRSPVHRWWWVRLCCTIWASSWELVALSDMVLFLLSSSVRVRVCALGWDRSFFFFFFFFFNFGYFMDGNFRLGRILCYVLGAKLLFFLLFVFIEGKRMSQKFFNKLQPYLVVHRYWQVGA